MSDGDKPDEVIFRYNRARRLEHASEDVRKIYEDGYIPKKGFLGGLTSNAGSRSVFFSIIILCIAIVVISVFGNKADLTTLDGAAASLKAFPYDGSTYVTFEIAGSERAGKDPVPVTVILDCIDPEGQIVSSGELNGVYSGRRLILRTILEGEEALIVKATVSYASLTANLRTQVDRK
jgi:hypothetical protein